MFLSLERRRIGQPRQRTLTWEERNRLYQERTNQRQNYPNHSLSSESPEGPAMFPSTFGRVYRGRTLPFTHNYLNQPSWKAGKSYESYDPHRNTQRHITIFLASIASFTGLLWQCYMITAIYFTYDTVSEVHITKEDNVKPPAMSICFPYVTLLPWAYGNMSVHWPVERSENLTDPSDSMTPERWIKMKDGDKMRFKTMIQLNYTLGEIYDMTPDFFDLLAGSYVRMKDSFKLEKSKESLLVTKYLRDDLICYRINDKTEEHRSHRISYGRNVQTTMMIAFQKEKVSHISKTVVFLHGRNVFPRGDGEFPFIHSSHNQTTVFDNATSMIGITYSKVTMVFLEPPYKTSCFKYYKEEGYENEYHYVDKCVLNATYESFALTTFMYTYTNTSISNYGQYRIMPKEFVTNNDSWQKGVDNILFDCQNRFPRKECTKITYVPSLISLRASFDVTFLLYDMNGPETKLVSKPNTDTMEYIVQILSMIGIWLGVSCVDAIVNVSEIARCVWRQMKVRRRRKRKKLLARMFGSGRDMAESAYR